MLTTENQILPMTILAASGLASQIFMRGIEWPRLANAHLWWRESPKRFFYNDEFNCFALLL